MQILYSILSALCLGIGFYFGFKIGRTGELPKTAKIKKQEQKDDEKEKEISRLEKIIGNLNRYDGTSKGQEEIDNG